jgi:hypothetical protein
LTPSSGRSGGDIARPRSRKSASPDRHRPGGAGQLVGHRDRQPSEPPVNGLRGHALLRRPMTRRSYSRFPRERQPKDRVREPSILGWTPCYRTHRSPCIDSRASWGLPTAPAVIDVRTKDDFEADPRLPPTAQTFTVRQLGEGGPVVVVCRAGLKLTRASPRGRGIKAFRPRASKAVSTPGRLRVTCWSQPTNCERATRRGKWFGSHAPAKKSIASPAPG